MPIAAQLVAGLQQVSPTKLLADELEIVHAIRDLMDYRPERIVETARHVALKAAEPLSCEVGAVLIRTGGKVVVEVITRDWPARLDPNAIRATLVRLFDHVGQGPFLEPELEAAADDALGREQGLVARLALPIGRPEPFGVLVVAHAATHSRGFTNVCQRIGQALADAAESLLIQAITREELSAERDQFALEARTDALTGLPNRLAWQEILEAEEDRRSRYGHPVTIVSADLDQLKATNDRDGHAAGDRLICTAAGLLKRHARSVDRVARVGGDEFYVLLPETDAGGRRATSPGSGLPPAVPGSRQPRLASACRWVSRRRAMGSPWPQPSNGPTPQCTRRNAVAGADPGTAQIRQSRRVSAARQPIG